MDDKGGSQHGLLRGGAFEARGVEHEIPSLGIDQTQILCIQDMQSILARTTGIL